MSGLSKLSAALIIIFAISLLALLAELLYVIWRRRVFHRQTPAQTTSGTADINSQLTVSDSSSNFTSSKELLYFFFCLNSSGISRVEPAAAPPSLNSTEDDMEVIDVFKLQNMYGPSRVLFTIKEEDRENDGESEKSLCSSAEKGTAKKQNTTSKRVNLEECFKAADEESAREEAEEVSVAVEDIRHINIIGDQIGLATPFSTPCESPSYFTPSASPIREAAAGKVDSGQIEASLCTA